MSNFNKPSWLHRSKNWGKPHVDLGPLDHGHSPTVCPPSGVGPDGTISVRRLYPDMKAGKFSGNLPPPYGPIPDPFRRDK